MGCYHQQNQSLSAQLQTSRAVLLPGAGFDDHYLSRCFTQLCHDYDIEFIAHRPHPDHLIEGYWDHLNSLDDSRPLIVGGMSIGAVVAIRWALDHPHRLLGVVAVLPPWCGPAGGPAALSARYNAAKLRNQGLQACITQLYESCPHWLAQELSQSWTRQWPWLPQALDQASSYPGPTTQQLSTLQVPVGIVGAPDDQVHPFAVAQQWANWLPWGQLVSISLDHIGQDPTCLGQASLYALDQAIALADSAHLG